MDIRCCWLRKTGAVKRSVEPPGRTPIRNRTGGYANIFLSDPQLSRAASRTAGELVEIWTDKPMGWKVPLKGKSKSARTESIFWGFSAMDTLSS